MMNSLISASSSQQHRTRKRSCVLSPPWKDFTCTLQYEFKANSNYSLFFSPQRSAFDCGLRVLVKFLCSALI